MKFTVLLGCVLLFGLNHANTRNRENIALNKIAKQSSTLEHGGYRWEASFVLDGNANFSNDCQCCSLTTGYETPWLEVDLGSIYNIGRIDVYGRPDVSYYLRLFSMYLGETSISTGALPDYKSSASESDYLEASGHFTIIFGNKSVRYLQIKDQYLQFNQMVICEIEAFEACEDFHFEPDCSPCHCYAHPCNKSTGLCPSVCMPGWQGMSCNISCEAGKYGINCSNNCRCQNSAACDRKTGECYDRKCVLGWKGKYCNISTLISERKSVKMSSQYYTWSVERAVDGDIKTQASNCDCCAATRRSDFPWFKIDLGMPYRIAHIIIYGRTDNNNLRQSFYGLNIYAAELNNVFKDNLINDVFIKTTYFLNLTLDTPVVTQYITMNLGRGRQMVICELQLFEGECDDGSFGRLCNVTCYCLGQPCDKESGECPSSKCLPGYQGDTCSEACDDGHFGSGCNKTCGFCFNNTVCDKVQGHCESCAPGYRGNLCKESCDNNTFGLNCSLDCGECKESVACDHVTGQCQFGCKPGYIGHICNDTCSFGKYGDACALDCGHCANNQTCNITNGHCGEDGCVEGYIQPLCAADNQKQSPSALSTEYLALIHCGAWPVLLAVVIVAVVLYRRRKQKQPPNKDVACEDPNVGVDTCKNTSIIDVPDIPVKDTEAALEKIESSREVSEDIQYYAFSPRSDDIKVHKIWDYVHKGMENDCEAFYEEFETLRKGLQYECKEATGAKNRTKNRYKDIYAYDDNRVKLLPEASNPPETDYINASYIDGYEKLAKFIACQGPTKQMVDDFWRMIWQQQCRVIVMLTNIYELDVLKCLQYWPCDKEPIVFGNIVVKLLNEEQQYDYVLRTLEIKNCNNFREVKQYHFTSWPDKTVPDTIWSLVNFWRSVRNGSNSETSPVVVHCSAGVGRTGTFIALDNLYHQAKSEGCIRPLQMVETLRKQRVNMVQTKEQYVYMHEAVAEALLLGTHYIKPEQFEDVYNYLTQTEEGESKTNMEIQFDLIEKSLQDELTECEMNKAKQAETNKTDAILNIENFKEKENNTESVYTNMEDSIIPYTGRTADKIGKTKALRVPGYKDEPVFIVLPVSNNDDTLKAVVDFIETENAQTIIELKGDLKSLSALNNNIDLDDVEVKVLQEKQAESYKQTDILFTIKNKQKVSEVTRSIRKFEYFDWNTEDNVPKTTTGFLDFLSEVQMWQPVVSRENPVIIISCDPKRHGILCVVFNECMRVRSDDKVNIVETVKTLRQLDSACITNFAQYKFCYDILKNCVQQSELYANL